MTNDTGHTKRSVTERIEVAGDQLADTVRKLFEDASARRVTIRTKEGKELVSVPLTLGVAGGAIALLVAPALALVAAIGGAIAKLDLEIERDDPQTPGDTRE